MVVFILRKNMRCLIYILLLKLAVADTNGCSLDNNNKFYWYSAMNLIDTIVQSRFT